MWFFPFRCYRESITGALGNERLGGESKIGIPPMNMEPDSRSLQKESCLPGPPCQVPIGGRVPKTGCPGKWSFGGLILTNSLWTI